MAVMDTQPVLLCLASIAVTGFSFTTFNAARYKPANQSSVFIEYSTAEKAVDGNYDPYFLNYSCACTDDNDLEPWWSVDLGREYHVTSVRITNRLKYGSRLHDVTVAVRKGTSATSTVCGHYPGPVPDGVNVTVTCGKLTLGRYVQISKPRTESHDFLTICEVEVLVVKTRMTLKRLVGKSSQENGTVAIGTTMPDCAHACLHSDSCMGVKYSSRSSQCQLLTLTPSATTTGICMSLCRELYLQNLTVAPSNHTP